MLHLPFKLFAALHHIIKHAVDRNTHPEFIYTQRAQANNNNKPEDGTIPSFTCLQCNLLHVSANGQPSSVP